MTTTRNLAGAIAMLVAFGAAGAQSDTLEYSVSFPNPAAHAAAVTAIVPTHGRSTIELMMPIWSPGYYKVENYADKVHDLVARGAAGAALEVGHVARNRWRIDTHGARLVTVAYDVTADVRFVTSDWVGDSLIVLNGAPTFVTIADSAPHAAEVRLALPDGWRSATSLDSVPGVKDAYRARSYGELVDSPIIAGNLRFHSFVAGGRPHTVVDAGELGNWDSDRAARDIARFANENGHFWGSLPYERYVFLNVFRRGGGGLEHANSTLLTSNAGAGGSPAGYLRWLNFVSHEYFHALTVKRLRPVELGPFDYEAAPKTPSLWISEGLTTYYGDLMVARAGLAGTTEFLDGMSALIGQLQNTPGRRVQTLSASSLDVWNSENSAVGMDKSTTVSYYTKGPVVGLLLDAHIRRLTSGRRSLDDVMRTAYSRYGGAHGFTPEQFRAVASEVAGANLDAWFLLALDSTEELDYQEMLDWYGLQFTDGSDPKAVWRLEPRPNATGEQKAHLAALLVP